MFSIISSIVGFFFACSILLVVIGGIYTGISDGATNLYYHLTGDEKQIIQLAKEVKTSELDKISEIAKSHKLNEAQLRNIAAALKLIDLDFNRVKNYKIGPEHMTYNVPLTGVINLKNSGTPEVTDELPLFIYLNVEKDIYRIDLGNKFMYHYECPLFRYNKKINSIKDFLVTEKIKDNVKSSYKNLIEQEKNTKVKDFRKMHYTLRSDLERKLIIAVEGETLIVNDVYGQSKDPHWQKIETFHYDFPKKE